MNKKKDDWAEEHYESEDSEYWEEDRLGDEYKDFIWE